MFKVVGPLWAQATTRADNVFSRLLINGKKILQTVLRKGDVAKRELPKSTWSLRATPIHVGDRTSKKVRLIGGLFPQNAIKTAASEARRQAAIRLISGSRRIPVFAFVGLTLGVSLEKGQTDDAFCSEIRDLFRVYAAKSTLVGPNEEYKLETLELGQLIGKGCSAAVYEARNIQTKSDEATTSPKDREELKNVSASFMNVPLSPEALSVSAIPHHQQAVKTTDENYEAPDITEPSSFPSHHQSLQNKDEDFVSYIEAPDVTKITFFPSPKQCLKIEDEDLTKKVFLDIAAARSLSCQQLPVKSNSEDFVSSSDPALHSDVCEEKLEFEDRKSEVFSIVSDHEVEDENDGMTDLKGWALYRFSKVPAELDVNNSSDTESDIFVLAGEEEDLDLAFDVGEVESSWTIVPLVIDSNAETMVLGSETSMDSSSLECKSTSSTSVSATRMDSSECSPSLDYPLAVKVMFNYSVESNADRILSAMARETLPAHISSSNTEKLILEKCENLPPHPNIVTMHNVFVDQMPSLPESMTDYPAALPQRLNKDGLGRNSTLFLVMKKYNMTMREYLSSKNPDISTRCLLLAQLLEGVAHLSSHGIAHRDLKSNNILVDFSFQQDQPLLAICDFGCCLADKAHGLQIPYQSAEVNKGGNPVLMAPEIKCAEPGDKHVLDYSKADLWAAGSLAYEIFGMENPFYSCSCHLDSLYYKEEELPELPDNVPLTVRKLVRLLLKRDPNERPSSTVAATVMQLFLWSPTPLQPFTTDFDKGTDLQKLLWRQKEFSVWLKQFMIEVMCQLVFGGDSHLQLLVKHTFLSRVTQHDLLKVALLA